jgi:hypothetical protein
LTGAKGNYLLGKEKASIIAHRDDYHENLDDERLAETAQNWLSSAAGHYFVKYGSSVLVMPY